MPSKTQGVAWAKTTAWNSHRNGMTFPSHRIAFLAGLFHRYNTIPMKLQYQA
ncbi:MAG: hypothetical protein IKZ17_00765 [Bacteroidaceae bacterium]|nr:hypothetical protein [Bacteroidaceae bacterium]